MQPFVRMNEIRMRPSALAALDAKEREAYEQTRRAVEDGIVEVWQNDQYEITKYRLERMEGWPAMVYLSIKRRDRATIRDWRHLQQIKNAVTDPECEAVELFPAESRLVDTANQYHLWVIEEPGVRWPFGFTQRDVLNPEDVADIGARQRDFKGENR